MMTTDGEIVIWVGRWRLDHAAQVGIAGYTRKVNWYWVETRRATERGTELVCGCWVSGGVWNKCQSHQRGIAVRVGSWQR